jgi:hypothetical protein
MLPGNPQRKNCSACGATFTCGPESPQEKCWCDDLPMVSMAIINDQGCLCPECLSQAISNSKSSRLDDAAAPSSAETSSISQPVLVEGEDYYREGTMIVFTARYHLRRGYCCHSGCRHCPYQEQL